ncbi:MraY family glycosyltransferase [Marinigracilibium pacificum]|uniref:Undecaprenyl/decaprenyl-phosphate alpha-N-acetylglucosaminyl 1-phosphate transferase n=1 Tax=Marinigracilibium pacificum TaxID=2729599 RepID=A0A848IV28_9BACT|nr:MraY family glycosyltransferase [Marinigracilibium pacificum]NMM47145.1 undecaprenyl/decaprenyl-phosphate alpha-N-acetylglucosaminyl 1-phosphate transferase [Marinigracilibium pacificum]
MSEVNVFLSFLWAALVSLYAIPSIVRVATKKKLFDRPNHRTIHDKNIPRLGGLAIFAGFVSALSIFGIIEGSVQYLLAGVLLIFFIGIKDDIIEVTAIKKLLVQILAAGVIIFLADIRLTNLDGLFGIYEIPDSISYFLSFIILIGLTNAINLIDGLDGLAGTIVFIISITFGVLFFLQGSLYSFVGFSMAGAVFGFLRHNYKDAKIFMGDTGSLVCGFTVGVMALEYVVSNNEPGTAGLAIAILIIPVLDTTRVFVIRILKGVNPFDPDRNHIHHRLLGLNLNHSRVVLTLAAINIIFVTFALYLKEYGSDVVFAVVGIAAFIFSMILEVKTKPYLPKG